MLFDLPLNTKKRKAPAINFRLYLASLSSVKLDNFPSSVLGTVYTNPLLDGKSFNYIDAKAGTISPETNVGESPATGKLRIPVLLEDLSKESLTWIYENQDERVIAVWERCADGQRFLAGSPCSGGLAIKLDKIGFSDGISFNLEGDECPEPFWFYDGELIVSKIKYYLFDFTDITDVYFNRYKFHIDNKNLIYKLQTNN